MVYFLTKKSIVMKATFIALASPWLKTSVLFLLFISSLSLSAQEMLTFDFEKGISIQQDVEKMTYETSFQLESKFTSNQYVDYFKHFNTQLTTLIVNQQSGQAIISLEKRMKPNWTTYDWNLYLNEIHQTAIANHKNK